MSKRRPFTADFPELEIEETGVWGEACIIWLGDERIYTREYSVPSKDGYTLAILRAGVKIGIERAKVVEGCLKQTEVWE